MYFANFTVIYDANVLYPNFLRDLLMRLAPRGLFRARWTEDIHREWMESLLRDAVLRNHPTITRERLERTRALMDRHVLDALVTGYESLIPGLILPDLDDRHVLAAAIKAQAQLIITRNHKDFPPSALEPYGVKTQGPDDFVSDLWELDEQTVLAAIEEQLRSFKNPRLTRDEYCQALERQQLNRTAASLRNAWQLTA